MNLFTGHAGALKDAFYGFIKEHKKNHFDKALVVLPGGRLQSVLKREAAQKLGVIANIYFTDFLSLALEVNAAAGDVKPLLPDTYRQDFIIKNILRRRGAAHARGYVRALKAALRDLINAQVTPQILRDIKEENFDPEAKEQLTQLAGLYEDYLAAIKDPRFNTYAQTLQNAAQNAGQSAYLKSFGHIIFYGFYDFTALQYDLFNAVCDNFETQVFLPYENLNAYNFIKNFYEANLLPKAKITKLAPPSAPIYNLAAGLFEGDAQKTAAEVKIISVSGAAAEIESAAKEILALKEERGFKFEDIALTARTLENYKADILDILAQNKIPAQAGFDTPLLEHPLAAFIFNLLNLARGNFYKEDVAAVLCSPYFKGRSAAWPAVIKKIGASAGYAQWLDLLPLAKEESATSLAKNLETLKFMLAALERQAGFETLCKNVLNVIETFTDAEALTPREGAVLQSIRGITEQLKELSSVREEAQKEEFLEEFFNLLKEAKISKTATAHNGVNVADIMSLRGQSFKAVIIMGLNEGSLPAAPKEDPVLKDAYRKLLYSLGYMIHKQSDRYDEEKLLFYFALSSAGEAAALIYQRADEEGKPKIPSLYLTQVLDALGQNLEENDNFILSRRPAEKYRQWNYKYLTQKEAAALAALSAKSKTAALAQVLQPDDKALHERLFNAAQTLNGFGALTPFDGVVEKDNALWAAMESGGVSPTNLQTLFKCPARYLFDKITGKDEAVIFERGQMPARQKGSLYHKILEEFYKYLKRQNLFDKLFAGGAKEMLRKFLAAYLPQEGYKDYGLYPVVWGITAAEMEAYLQNLVEQDLRKMQELGFTPQLFEQKLSVEIELEKETLKLTGAIDRADLSADGQTYRIIDYKTSKENAGMERAIFQKSLLQPPLYFEMAARHETLKDKTPQAMSLMTIENDKGGPNKDLPYDEYLALRPKFLQLLSFLKQTAKEGLFIINPGKDNCLFCRYEDLCRKAHGATLRRAKNSAGAKKLKEYHDVKTKRPGAKG